jgi:catechol O-methyltransferase
MLRNQFGVTSVDLVFIDHVKEYFQRDLKKLENSKLMHVGTVIVADNIKYPVLKENASN